MYVSKCIEIPTDPFCFSVSVPQNAKFSFFLLFCASFSSPRSSPSPHPFSTFPSTTPYPSPFPPNLRPAAPKTTLASTITLPTSDFFPSSTLPTETRTGIGFLLTVGELNAWRILNIFCRLADRR